MTQVTALALLMECTGREIWPPEVCLKKRVPQAWIDELSDRFESGFDIDRHKIYYNERLTNQFYGVFDRDLAFRLGRHLGVDVDRVTAGAINPEAEVDLIKEAVLDE